MICYALMNDAGEFQGKSGAVPFHRAMNYIRPGQMDKPNVYHGRNREVHWPGKLPGFHEVKITFRIGVRDPNAGAVYWVYRQPNGRWHSRNNPKGVSHVRAAELYDSVEKAPLGAVPVSLLIQPEEVG